MSFRLKTIIGIALIETVLLILLVFSALSFLSESTEKLLLQRVETTSRLFTHATKDALLATDLATLESFTNEILTDPDVVYVRIIGNGSTLAEGGSEQAMNTRRGMDQSLADVDDGIFDITTDITEGGILFGQIQLGLSVEPIQLMFAEARRWTVGIAGLEVFLVGIFSLALGTYLTRQIQRLREGTQIIEKSGPGHQIAIDSDDELGELARSFNYMSLSLQDSYSALQDSLDQQSELLSSASRNEAKTRAILSSSLDALVIIDMQGKVIDFNHVAEDTFGWRRAEILGKSMSDHIVPTGLRAAHEQGMQEYRNSGKGPVLDKRLTLDALHKDGHEFPVELSISPVKIGDETLFTAFVRDISDRVATETELRLAAKAFDTSEAMFIADADINIIRTNQAFTQITGYTQEEAVGRNPGALLKSGKHDAAFYQEMWQHLKEDGAWSGEIQNRRKNGEIFPEYLTISTFRDADGDVSHYIAHFIDISEQKAHEASLQQARVQAEAASIAKGRFLATMSHEIRTPLNAVLGIMDMLKDTPLDGKQLDLVEVAKGAGTQLLGIINDILDFSKMEAGKLQLSKSAFDLHTLLVDATEMLQTQATIKELGLSLAMSEGVPRYALGDPGRLRQVLINLVNNAIKFTPSGQVSVRVSHSPEPGGTFRLECEVEDTGIGISPEFRDKLFDEFTMADGSHARMHEGSGLGLAICKQLVKLMDGDISVRSEPGKGSTFRFDIRLGTAQRSDIADVDDEDSTAHFSDQTVRILLAEDNPANQMIIRSVLQDSRLTLDTVGNGREALKAVQSAPYDLVLMDISMPEMDGIAATRAIRRLPPPLGDIPIIAITAHAMKSDEERFLAAGMNAHLSKPIDRKAVLKAIARWTRESPQQAGSPDEGQPPEEVAENAQAQPPLVDEEVLAQLARDTSPQVVPELLIFYIDDARKLLNKIADATRERDFANLEFHSHTLGSSSGAHANARLHVAARRIEQLCRGGEHEQALTLAGELPAIAEQSLAELSATAERLASANKE